MSLNLNKIGSPIAIIKGGKYDGKIVSVTADKDDGDGDGLFKSFSSMKLTGDAKFAVYPNNKIERSIGYISGASGSGKSTFIKHYVDHYHKLFPRNPIYLLSRKGQDDSLDSPLIKRIRLDESFYQDPIPYEEFANSLVLSDDLDTVKKPVELRNAINHLLDEIMELGRSLHVSLLVTSHVINRSSETRNIINEAHFVVLFLKSSSTYTYFLQQYMGFNLKQIRKLKKIEGRSITINRGYPNTIIGERDVMLAINLDDDI